MGPATTSRRAALLAEQTFSQRPQFPLLRANASSNSRLSHYPSSENQWLYIYSETHETGLCSSTTALLKISIIIFDHQKRYALKSHMHFL
jgi:hypothetical protein